MTDMTGAMFTPGLFVFTTEQLAEHDAAIEARVRADLASHDRESYLRIIDERAGREHSRDGAVASCLDEILTLHAALVRAELAEEIADAIETDGFGGECSAVYDRCAEIARFAAGSSRDTTPDAQCSKCGNPQTKCSECDEPAQCGETTCVAHAWVDTTPEASDATLLT